ALPRSPYLLSLHIHDKPDLPPTVKETAHCRLCRSCFRCLRSGTSFLPARLPHIRYASAFPISTESSPASDYNSPPLHPDPGTAGSPALPREYKCRSEFSSKKNLPPEFQNDLCPKPDFHNRHVSFWGRDGTLPRQDNEKNKGNYPEILSLLSPSFPHQTDRIHLPQRQLPDTIPPNLPHVPHTSRES